LGIVSGLSFSHFYTNEKVKYPPSFYLKKLLLMPSYTTKRFLSIAGWILIAIIGLYITSITVSHYFNFTRESFTDYFWPRRYWLIIHITGGITALLVGQFQFFKKLRVRRIKLHRMLGKIYLTSILISAPIGLYLALTSNINFVYATGLSLLAITWFSTATMGYISIRKGNIIQHREWMIRSYVVTSAFLFFRIGAKLLEGMDVGPFEMRFALLSWACWSIPLFISEIFLQAGKIRNVKQTTMPKTKIESKMESLDMSLLK